MVEFNSITVFFHITNLSNSITYMKVLKNDTFSPIKFNFSESIINLKCKYPYENK